MSVKVVVLQEGYSRWHIKPDSMLANGTATLVRLGSGESLVVDTLGPWDRDRLVAHLARHDLTPDRGISMVIGTHHHVDHIGNLNLFTHSKMMVGGEQINGDYFEFNLFKTHKTISLTKDIDLVWTPGHTGQDVSVLCRNVDQHGTVAIVGDLFESAADLRNEQIWLDAGSADPEQQRQNRNYILSVADYIIPGHGPMFRVRDHLPTSI